VRSGTATVLVVKTVAPPRSVRWRHASMRALRNPSSRGGAAVRLSPRADHDRHGRLRARGQSDARTPGDRIVAVRSGPRSRHLAELLPAIVSVTLARGARAMARRGVIVRRLEAIEDLGGMDVLCTTRPDAHRRVMALDAAVDAEGAASAAVLKLAYLNAALETGIENPLDAALVAAGESASLATAGWAKIDEVPYDFIRKRLTIVVATEEDPGHHRIIMKGRSPMSSVSARRSHARHRGSARRGSARTPRGLLS